MSAELDRGRRLARRRMAWASFLFLLVSGSLLMYGLVLGDSRESVAAAVSVASGVVTGLFTVFTTIVLGYLGVSVCERIFNKKRED